MWYDMVKQRINQAPGSPILPCGPRLSQNWKGGYRCVYHMMLHFNFPRVGAQKKQQPGILTARTTCHVRMTWTTISKVKKKQISSDSRVKETWRFRWPLVSPLYPLGWSSSFLGDLSRIRVLVNITSVFFSLKIAMLFFIKTTSYC